MSSDNVSEASLSESSESVLEIAEPTKETAEFLELENGYRSVLSELEKDEELSKYAAQFTRLFKALYVSFHNEEKLISETQDLQDQLSRNRSQISIAMRTQISDQETIANLKKEVEISWKTVDAAQTRERIALETIENLHSQISRLNAEIDLKSRQESDHVAEFGTASKNKDVLARERERLIHDVTAMKEKMNVVNTLNEQMERQVSAVNLEVVQLNRAVQSQASEVTKMRTSKEHVEAELNAAKVNLVAKQREIDSSKHMITTLNKSVISLELSLRDSKQNADRLKRDNDTLKARAEKTMINYESQTKEMETLIVENIEKTKEIMLKEDKVTRLQSELQLMKKDVDMLEKRVYTSVLEKAEVDKENQNFKLIVERLEREIVAAKKKMAADAQLIDTHMKEKDILCKNLKKNAETAREQMKMLDFLQHVKLKLEAEIERHGEENAKLKTAITRLEKERDRYVGEAKELTQQMEDTVEEVKMKQQTIYEHKKALAEADTKYRMQQSLYEQVRADKNNFSKNLLESEDQVVELKLKLKVMTHQIQQLKEDVSSKETLLMRGEFALQKSEKEKEAVKVELQNYNLELKGCKATILEMQKKQEGLEKMIKQADIERERKQNALDQTMNERDILGTQLVRRNDELSLLYEKIKLLQYTLHNGESQYEQRMEDIRLLKLEIKKLRQEKGLLSKNISNMADLRQEILHLQRDLTREGLKCRALEEELQNPLNMHRWRKLEGTDPGSYELIQKVQILQKRLIAQSSSAQAREQQLRETEQLCGNMRQLLMRQPGPDTLNRLHETQLALKEKGTKMRCMLSELTMQEAQLAECKLDLERTNQELHDFKQKYYDLKRREERRKEKTGAEPNQSSTTVLSARDSKPRFTGGGFSLTPGQRQSATFAGK